MVGEFQCHCSSFGIGRIEGKGRIEKSIESSTDKIGLATTLETPIPAHYYFCILMTLYPVPFKVGLAVKGEASLISHTPIRKQVPMQKEEIIVMLPPAVEKEAILHDTSVAIAAHLHCLISRSIPTLLFAENALQNFLSSYICCNMHMTSKLVSRSQVLSDPIQFKPYLWNIIAIFNQSWFYRVAASILKNKLSYLKRIQIADNTLKFWCCVL